MFHFSDLNETKYLVQIRFGNEVKFIEISATSESDALTKGNQYALWDRGHAVKAYRIE